jgi:hypothetical protein
MVQDVLSHQAGRYEAYAITVHQLQEIPPGLINEGDAGQVNRKFPVRVVRLGSVPTVF